MDYIKTIDLYYYLFFTKKIFNFILKIIIIKINNKRLRLKKQKIIYVFYTFIYHTTFIIFSLIYIKNNKFIFYNNKNYIYNGNLSFYLEFLYKIPMVFYINEINDIFLDPKRKDFYVMFLHHIISLVLILFSYENKIIKHGMLILVLHDFSNPFLDLSKLFLYLGFKEVAKIIFIIFSTSFYINRLFIFPFYLIKPLYSFLFKKNKLNYQIMFFFLIFLQIIHIIWSIIIFKILKKGFFSKKKIIKDILSDSK